jgi:hypothetical protein
MSIEGLRRELLVRYLDTWVPDALRGTRRATFVQAWPGGADVDGAEAALRVFAEFADHMRGRTLTLVFVAPTLGDLGRLEVAGQIAHDAQLGLADAQLLAQPRERQPLGGHQSAHEREQARNVFGGVRHQCAFTVLGPACARSTRSNERRAACQADRNKNQARRNKSQTQRNKIKIGRNKIKIFCKRIKIQY